MTQIPLNSTQTGNKAYCRGMNFYVNLDSSENMELGTKEYPYKSLTLVFVEILNYFSHKEVTINIYVKERTTNYLELNKNYLINLTAVNLLTYSDAGETNERASLILTDQEVEILGEKTQFSVLKNSNLNVSIVSAQSILAFESTQKNIVAFKSSVSLTNFDITSDYSNRNTNNKLILAIMVNGKFKVIVAKLI